MSNDKNKIEVPLTAGNLSDFKNYWIYAIYRKACFILTVDKFIEKFREKDLKELFGEELEVHIFNKDEEYRYVKNKLNKENLFQKITDTGTYEKFEDIMIFKNTIKDERFTNDDRGEIEIKVINYYKFEEGMIKFENYRLAYEPKIGGDNNGNCKRNRK